MPHVTPVAMVIDRATAGDVAADIRALGGAWAEMFDGWCRAEGEYLVLLAHTQERMAKRAPLTLMCLDREHLRKALRMAFAQAAGLTVKWFLFVEKDVEALVREELALDGATGGNA